MLPYHCIPGKDRGEICLMNLKFSFSDCQSFLNHTQGDPSKIWHGRVSPKRLNPIQVIDSHMSGVGDNRVIPEFKLPRA
jgi:hypothetical protein